MEEFTNLIKNRKTIIGLVILGLILLSLPLTIKLAQERQILPSRASEGGSTGDPGVGSPQPCEVGADGDLLIDGKNTTEYIDDRICRGERYTNYLYRDSSGQDWCNWTTATFNVACPTSTPDTPTPTPTPTPQGSFTGDSQACKDARSALAGTDSSWISKSCTEIATKVKNDCTIFVSPNTIRDTLAPGTCKSTAGVGSPNSPSASSSSGCQANTGRIAGDYNNPGLVWKKNCSSTCSNNAGCPPSEDGYILHKFSAESTNWCLEGSCAQPAVINPSGGSISCVGNPSCVYSPTNPQVALNTSWQGLKECWDLGGAGTTCNYVGADLCVEISSPAHNYLCEGDNSLCTADKKWKLVASAGSVPKGKTIFPDGSFDKVPPSGGIGWIRPNMVYKFALFEDGYTASKQKCSDSSDTDCLDYQYRVKACKGKQVTTKVVDTRGSSSAPSSAPSPTSGQGQPAVTPTPTPTTATTPTPTPTPTPTTKTAFYRISTQQFSDDSGWQRYTDHPLRVEQLDLGNITPGSVANIYVQFKSDSGVVSQVIRKSIKYIGPDPSISRTACSYSPTGTGTEVIIEGSNFGERGTRGKVMFNGQDARISSWDRVASSSGDTTGSSSGPIWRIVASIRDRLQGGSPIPLFIETHEGRRAPVDGPTTCTINLTTLSFNAKSECRPSTDMAAENIKIQIRENTRGARLIFNQNINLNAEGNPIWTPPTLEVGKRYIMSVRGPKALGHKVEFEAQEGTNVIDEFRMLIGDIAPVSSPDNRVNTLDYGLLVSQWTIAKDAAKSADFNMDRRVNSIDYACLRQNFNKNGEDFPTD